MLGIRKVGLWKREDRRQAHRISAEKKRGGCPWHLYFPHVRSAASPVQRDSKPLSHGEIAHSPLAPVSTRLGTPNLDLISPAPRLPSPGPQRAGCPDVMALLESRGGSRAWYCAVMSLTFNRLANMEAVDIQFKEMTGQLRPVLIKTRSHHSYPTGM